MSRDILDAEAILQLRESTGASDDIEPDGHPVRMPISVAESESVDNLNQSLAGTMTVRDMHKTSLAGVRAGPSRSRMCEASATVRGVGLTGTSSRVDHIT